MNSRTFALILGIVLLLVGILGFVPGLVSHMEPATGAAPGDPGAAPGTAVVQSYGYLLGLFPINALHNLFHIVWGIFGIVAYRGLSGARTFAKATAIVYGLLTIMGLIPGLNTVFGLIPVYGHDVWLHALIALAAAYFGFAHRDEEVAVTPGATTATSTRR
jgi:Domain of unknown function (DUF4383)